MGSEATDPIEAKILGDYRLLQRIAIGGMAEIYEARRIHGDTTERLVVKILLPQHRKDATLIRSLEHEANINVALTHPGLIRVYGLEHAEGQPFIVMELVDGITLAELVSGLKQNDTHLPVAITLRIIVEVLSTLAHVHEAKDEEGTPLNIVHRDVTPQNIMLSRDGVVRLGDFGIARSNLRDNRTRTGVIKGKLQYLAPEQVTGSTIDARTDLYAVALILWELLTGDPYISGMREVDLLRKAETPTFRRPSTVGDTDPRFDKLLKRALGRFPEERFRDAAGFLTALKEIIAKSEPLADDQSLAALVRKTQEATAPAHCTLSMQATVKADLSSSSTRQVRRSSNPTDSVTSPQSLNASQTKAPNRQELTGSPTSQRTTWLLAILVVALLGAWIGPTLFTEEPEVTRLTQSPSDPNAAETSATLERSGPTAVPSDASLRAPPDEVDNAEAPPPTEAAPSRPVARQAATPPRARALPLQEPPAREPPPEENAPELAEPEGTSPVINPAERASLTARLRGIRGALSARGLSLADLTSDDRGAYAALETALGAGHLDTVTAGLPGLEARLRAVPIDRSLVQRKLDRVNSRIRSARARGANTTEIEALAANALQEFMNQRYEATNRRLNELLRLLAAAR